MATHTRAHRLLVFTSASLHTTLAQPRPIPTDSTPCVHQSPNITYQLWVRTMNGRIFTEEEKHGKRSAELVEASAHSDFAARINQEQWSLGHRKSVTRVQRVQRAAPDRFIYEGWRLADAVTNCPTGDQLANDLTAVKHEVCDFPYVLRFLVASRQMKSNWLKTYFTNKFVQVLQVFFFTWCTFDSSLHFLIYTKTHMEMFIIEPVNRPLKENRNTKAKQNMSNI